MRGPSTGSAGDEETRPKPPAISEPLLQYLRARKVGNHFLLRAKNRRLQEASEAFEPELLPQKSESGGSALPEGDVEALAPRAVGASAPQEASPVLTGVVPGGGRLSESSGSEVAEAPLFPVALETETVTPPHKASSRVSVQDRRPSVKPAWTSVPDTRTKSLLENGTSSRKSVRSNAPAPSAGSTVRALCTKVVEHIMFTVIVVLVIAAQSIYLCLDGQDGGVVDVLFCSFYIIEQTFRIGAYRAGYFHDVWNLGDLGLTMVTTLDVVLSVFLFPQNDSEFETLVFFRFFRLLRLVTIVRLLRFFKELWLLAANIMTSIRTVFWAWLLMSLLIYIFALVFYRTLKPQTCLAGSDADGAALLMYFGDLPTTMFTAFQLTTLEDWPDIADICMKHHAWLLALVLLLLVTNTYGVMHVTVAVFVNSALEAGSIRSEDIAKKAQEEHEATCKTLAQVFLEADRDGNGSLSKEEFKKVLENPSMVEKLHGAGLSKMGAAALFDILDIDGSDSLDGAEFVEGVLRSAGSAQNKDLIGVRCDVWRASLTVDEELLRTSSFLERRTKELEAKLLMAHQEASPIFERASQVLLGSSPRRRAAGKKLPPIDTA